MADNPFYIGYAPEKPGEESPNPLYPGYYTGKPIPRKPKRKYFVKPTEYQRDDIFHFIDAIEADIHYLPKKIADQVVDDFKQQLKVSIRPPGITAEQLDDYDTDSLPGAFGISISLNPLDWADPGKQLKKTFRGWWNAAANIEDFELRVRTDIWRNMLNEETFSNVAAPGQALIARTAGPGATIGVENPFVLKGRGVEKTRAAAKLRYEPPGPGDDPNIAKWVPVEGATDVYDEVKKYVIDFERNLEVPAKRDGTHDLFLNRLATAINTELQNKKGQIENPYQAAIELFDVKASIADGMGKFNFYNISGPMASLAAIKATIAGNPEITIQKAREAVQKLKDSAQGELDKLNAADAGSLMGRAKALADSGGIKPGSYKRLENISGEYASYLNNLLSRLQNSDNMGARQLQTAIEGCSSGRFLGKTLAGGDIVGESIQRKLLRDIESDLLQPLTAGVADADKIGNVLDNTGVDLIADRARMIAGRLQYERRLFAFDELAESLAKGRFFEDYFWKRAFRRFAAYTPGTIAENLLKRVGYFGFSITDAYVPDWLAKNELFNSVFGYKFNLSFEDGLGNTFKARLPGGLQYGNFAAGGFSTLTVVKGLREGLNDNAFVMLMTEDFNLMDPRHWQALITANGGDTPLISLKEDQLAELQKQLDTFKKWVSDHKELFGSRANLKSAQFWDGLIGALIKENADPDRMYYMSHKFIGVLERVALKLNKLQTKFLNSFIGKYIIKPIFGAKTIIAERVAKLVADAIAWLVAKAGIVISDGILTPIMEAVVKPVVSWCVKKILDIGGAILSAAIRMDFTKLMEGWEKTIFKVSKLILTIVLLPILIIMVIAWGFLGTVSTAISPLDPTRGNVGFGGGVYEGYPPGENAFVKATKDVFVKVGSGGEDTNPTQPYGNEDLPEGIYYRYEIKITPKVTISDAAGLQLTTYTDRVVARHSDGNSTELYNIGPISLSEFNTGSTIIIKIPESGYLGPLTDPLFENSMISNTVTVNLPAIINMSENPTSVSFTRSFEIGKYVPECPVNTTYKWMTKSYDGSIGHGSTAYWENLNAGGTELCSFGIPYIYRNGNVRSPLGPGLDDNICYRTIHDQNLRDESYGRALDVAPVAPAIEIYEVRLPKLEKDDRTWNINPGTDTCSTNTGGAWGYGFVAVSDDGVYTIYMTHMSNDGLKCSGSVSAGEVVGHLFTGWAAGVSQIHGHIEILENGSPIKPESRVCTKPE